ncbi:MAG: AprI/Inh family metalloprotease inhibitor [Variibacter sp.]|nr:AprI/Inh family metalloprotease inhibitor [Variibacter sp.]
MPARSGQPVRPLALAVAFASLVAGCGGGVLETEPAPPTAAASPAPADMAGRWALTATGATCAVNLAGGASPNEGAVRPEGGCPGNFYTTRKWTFENGALILRDHNGQPLAELRQIGPGRFEGQSTDARHVSLVR